MAESETDRLIRQGIVVTEQPGELPAPTPAPTMTLLRRGILLGLGLAVGAAAYGWLRDLWKKK